MQQGFSKPNEREQAKMEAYVNKKYTDKNFHFNYTRTCLFPPLD